MSWLEDERLAARSYSGEELSLCFICDPVFCEWHTIERLDCRKFFEEAVRLFEGEFYIIRIILDFAYLQSRDSQIYIPYCYEVPGKYRLYVIVVIYGESDFPFCVFVFCDICCRCRVCCGGVCDVRFIFFEFSYSVCGLRGGVVCGNCTGSICEYIAVDELFDVLLDLYGVDVCSHVDFVVGLPYSSGSWVKL